MRKIYLLLVVLLLSRAVYAQFAVYPWLPENGNKIKDFLPPDWEVLQSATGDLNHDSLPDIAAVIQQKYTSTETLGSDSSQQALVARPRILLVLFRNTKGDWKYRLALQNNVFILREGEGGLALDPFKQLAIAHQGLILDFAGGSGSKWALTYTFKYIKSQWILIAATEKLDKPKFGTLDIWNFDFESRKFRHSDSASSDTSPGGSAAKWNKLKLKKMKTFESFYRPWTWEVLPNLFL